MLKGPLYIFGRNSYIGRSLCTYLGEQGYDCRGVGSQECNLLDHAHTRRFFDSIERVPYSAIVLSVINKSQEVSYHSYQQNVRLLRNFLDAVASTPLQYLLYFSSVDVYGNCPALPIVEQSPIAPDTWYGLSKFSCEWMIRDFQNTHCAAGVVRIPGVFGKGENDRSVIGKLFQAIKAEEVLHLSSGGRPKRDYVSLFDVGRQVEALVRLRYAGVLNLVSGESLSIRELAEKIAALVNKHVRVTDTGPSRDRDFDLVFDNTLIRSVTEVDFSSIDTGLKTYL